MNKPEFKSFSDIKRYKNGLHISISEKIHGTNAQVCVYDEDGVTKIIAGSRTKWLDPFISDNFGFAGWVKQNEEALIKFLGHGTHYGEWYGSGINHGYELKEKRFALFSSLRWKQAIESSKCPDCDGTKEVIDGEFKGFACGACFYTGYRLQLPKGVDLVPIFYIGPFYNGVVEECMNKLKEEGSVLCSGYKRPEGVVIRFHDVDVLRKVVFDPEETGWNKKAPDLYKESIKKDKNKEMYEFVAEYLQPIRLEKLLSRDSTYSEQFPSSLPNIVKAYLEDLDKEFPVAEEKKKVLSKAVFPWIKLMIEPLTPTPEENVMLQDTMKKLGKIK